MIAPTEHKMAQLFASGQKGAELAKVMEEYADQMGQEQRDFLVAKIEDELPVIFGDEDEEKMKGFLIRFRKEASGNDALLAMANELEKFINEIVVCQGKAATWADELIKELKNE